MQKVLKSFDYLRNLITSGTSDLKVCKKDESLYKWESIMHTCILNAKTLRITLIIQKFILCEKLNYDFRQNGQSYLTLLL